MWGLVLALGFVEEGPYAKLGCRNEPLSRDRIEDVALLSCLLTKWNNERQKQQAALHLEQPEGADGFGRAGLGRGAINEGRNTSNGIMEGRKTKRDRTLREWTTTQFDCKHSLW
jgi:hypothetical protein